MAFSLASGSANPLRSTFYTCQPTRSHNLLADPDHLVTFRSTILWGGSQAQPAWSAAAASSVGSARSSGNWTLRRTAATPSTPSARPSSATSSVPAPLSRAPLSSPAADCRGFTAPPANPSPLRVRSSPPQDMPAPRPIRSGQAAPRWR